MEMHRRTRTQTEKGEKKSKSDKTNDKTTKNSFVYVSHFQPMNAQPERRKSILTGVVMLENSWQQNKASVAAQT